jgi:hypothetical protein
MLYLSDDQPGQDRYVRSFFFVAAAHLESLCKELAGLGLIQGNPMEGGQLSSLLNGVVAGFTGAEKAIDIFRSPSSKKQPYPYILTMVARVTVFFFCAAVSIAIGCQTSIYSSLVYFPYFGVAEIASFVTSLAIPTPRHCSWGPGNIHWCESLWKNKSRARITFLGAGIARAGSSSPSPSPSSSSSPPVRAIIIAPSYSFVLGEETDLLVEVWRERK